TPGNAKALWEHIKDLFHDNKDARAITLNGELRSIKLGSLTINAYCTKIKAMTDRLANLGEKHQTSPSLPTAYAQAHHQTPSYPQAHCVQPFYATFEELWILDFTCTVLLPSLLLGTHMRIGQAAPQQGGLLQVTVFFWETTSYLGLLSANRLSLVPVLRLNTEYADIFTKGLPSALFEDFRSSLSVLLPPAPTAGEY
nr:hybrid signal transduction histidine kinase M [Tanacetum cinerariifolium]